MQTTPLDLNGLDLIFSGSKKELINQANFEFHFLPKENQKYKITLTKSNKNSILNLKQKNNKTNKENEFQIDIEKDEHNIPEEIKKYISGF